VCHGVHVDNEIFCGQDEFAHRSSSYCAVHGVAAWSCRGEEIRGQATKFPNCFCRIFQD
jgi:hypothetical protein